MSSCCWSRRGEQRVGFHHRGSNSAMRGAGLSGLREAGASCCPHIASSWHWLALQSPHAPFRPIPIGWSLSLWLQGHRGQAASTQHATAQASEVVTQRQGMQLHHVYLHVSKMQGWKRCFSPLCLYSGATKGHTLWSVPHSSCNRACKSFVVAVWPGAQQCFQLPTPPWRALRVSQHACKRPGAQAERARALTAAGMVHGWGKQSGLPGTAGIRLQHCVCRRGYRGWPTRCHGHESIWVLCSLVFLTEGKFNCRR